jgi:hypothetical protein
VLWASFRDFNVQIDVYACDVVEEIRGRWERLLTSTLPELILLLLLLLIGFADDQIIVSDAACLCASSVHVVRLFVPSLLALLDVSPRRTAAAKSHLYEPGKDGESTCHPHEGEQRGTYLRRNVQLSHTTDSVAEDDEHDGCNDRGDGYEEGVEEGEDGDEEGKPARVDGDGHDEDEDKGQDGSGEEKTEHPV